jgi:succinate dehydrogenase/fumarate reductase flavoprotein subunit
MSEDGKRLKAGVDRRGFIKGIAATGALATISAVTPGAAAPSGGTAAPAQKSWRDKPDPIDEALISDGGTYDIVVVGGGISGTFCARVAAMKGASVAVVENQDEAGYTWVGTEVGTINSRYAQAHGAPRIDEDDFIREWARRNVIRNDPKRASYFAKHSGRILDWAIEDMSPEWLAENTHIMSCPPSPLALTEVSGWKFFFGTTIFRKMTDCNNTFRFPEVMRTHYEKAKADGARWFFEHHAEICDQGDAGAVTGIVAKRADGTFVRFKARKAVALCAGDFSGNREMVIDILDTIRHEAEAKGNLDLIMTSDGFSRLVRDGSSIKLGIWAGGHIEIGPRSGLDANGEPGVGEWHLQLDENGQRFCDEAAGTLAPRPKDGFTVTLHDANWQKVLEMMPPRHMAPDTAHTISWPARLQQLDNVKPGPPTKDKQGEQRAGMWGRGTVYCANTVEDLIDYMDCYKGETKSKALAEIKRYRELCKKGMDEDFGKDPRILMVTALKDPPFYGSIAKNGARDMFGEYISPGLCATTGLDTDADGHVLNSEFKPIKGLYAAGNNAGNRFIVVYQTPLSGISLGMAMTEGYMLGERLADL